MVELVGVTEVVIVCGVAEWWRFEVLECSGGME
jgi:hypothetical protein